MAWSYGLAVVAMALLASDLPPLPTIPPAGFTPAIRTQVQEAEAAARAKPTDGAAAGRLGMILHAYQQFESAEACYRRARALDPNEVRWSYYLGLVESALGRHADAVGMFEDVVRRRPDYTRARLRLADAQLAALQLPESAAGYEAFLRLEPDAAAAHYGLGQVKRAQEDLAAARDHYRRACELFPGFGAAHYALAAVYRDLGELDNARAELALHQKTKLGLPPRVDSWLETVEALKTGAYHAVKRGIALEAAGDVEAAIAEHERAVQQDPTFVHAHVNLVSLYGRAGRPDKGEEHYRAALRLNPNLDDLHYNYGVLLLAKGDETGAAEAFRKALDVNPNYAEAHNNYAYLLMTQGKLDDAARHYRAAIENKPNYRAPHFNLGRILIQQGKTAEAIEHLEQTLAPEDAETPTYLYALGAAHARMGSRARAIEYIRAARDKAAAAGQTDLLRSIERDLETLERGGRNP